MKKIVFSLVVLLFAAPALATTVTIDACDIGGGEVEIWYTTDNNLPRAFGLDITVSDGNIIACVPAMVGECNDVLQGYGIFPGTIQIAGDGTVTDDGTPVAPADDPGALGGINTDGITIEMGSLYVDGNEPGTSGLLCTITVTEDCTVTIAGNAARCGEGSPARGVIMVDPDEVPDVNYIPGDVFIYCFPSDHPDFGEWQTVGEPDSWCWVRQCHGDADNADEVFGRGRVWVGLNDITVLVAGFRVPYSGDPLVHPWIAADFDHADEVFGRGRVRVGLNDITVLVNYFRVPTVPDDCLD